MDSWKGRFEMKKTKEQLKSELIAAWKKAIERTNDDEGVTYRVYLDHDFDFRVLYTGTREATYCVVCPDDYGVKTVDEVEPVVSEFFDEIFSGIEETEAE
jgi:hypothetical protein